MSRFEYRDFLDFMYLEVVPLLSYDHDWDLELLVMKFKL